MLAGPFRMSAGLFRMLGVSNFFSIFWWVGGGKSSFLSKLVKKGVPYVISDGNKEFL